MINPLCAMSLWIWPEEETMRWHTFDNPPEIGQRVLIWDGENILIDTYSGRDGDTPIWYDGTNHHRRATHWMRLPDTPH